ATVAFATGVELCLRSARGRTSLTRCNRPLHCLRILRRTFRFAHWIKRRNHVGKEVCEVKPRRLDPFQLIRKVKREHCAFLILLGQTRNCFVLNRFHFLLRSLRDGGLVSLCFRGGET